VVDAEQPRWLSEEEQRSWVALVCLLVNLPAALDAQLQADANLNHVEYVVLSWLSMSPEQTTRMSALASVSNTTLSHLSRIVTRLEKCGWVRRAPDPQDGRSTLAILTDAGLQKVAATAPGHVETVRSLVFDPLTKAQARQLQVIVARLLHALGSCHDRPETPAARS
jgi:DNA-binding MarR family transcriptional regulator